MPQVWLIEQGRVLDPKTGTDEVTDLVIDGGVVASVGAGAVGRNKASLEAGTAERISDREQHLADGRVGCIDATGLWVTPGFVDLHVHLREPGQEHKETIASGLRAAAAGGFTTVCAMPNTSPVNDCAAITDSMLMRAEKAQASRLFVVAAATQGTQGQQLSEMGSLREAGAIGVSDDGRCIARSSVMRHVLEYAKGLDLLVSQHAEDHDLTHKAEMHEGAVSERLGLRGWPREAEDIIVARDLILNERIRARYHVAHISSMGAVRLVREAKARGQRVSAEVTPHHLLLTEHALLGYDTCCKVNPPLRSEEDREALLEAFIDGTIDCIATDHAPHAPSDKDCSFSDASVGINGLEVALAALLQLVRDGRISAMRLVEGLSASAVSLVPEIGGGTLGVGHRADVCLIDPAQPWIPSTDVWHSKTSNSPWFDQQNQGRVWMTMVGGRVVHRLAGSAPS